MSDHVLPREDLRALEGYHSAQVDVAVRLNTNESPYPPPDAFLARWTAALREAELHRYPDRAALALRTRLAGFLDQPTSRLFAANGSNEVLQTLLLTYGGPGRRAAMFEPTYALHSHIARITGTEVVVGERAADFSIDVAAAEELLATAHPTVLFVCSPNNPTGTVDDRAQVEKLATLAAEHDALLVVDEAYGEFAPWSAVELVDESRPIVVVRTYSKVWSLAAIRLGFAVAPEWVVDELEKVALPYALSVPTLLAGEVALDFRTEMEVRVAALVEERGRLFAALAEQPGLQVFPSGANFLLFRVDGDAHAVWEGLLERGVLVRDFSRWPRVEQCLRVTVGTPAENDAFLAALQEVLSVTRSAQLHRETKETTVDVTLEVDGTGTTEVSTGIAFFDHMLEQLGKHAGFDLAIRATGDLAVDLHHTVEDVGIVLGNALREALGDKAGVRRFANALVPLDEALVQVAIDLSGRPFLVYDIDPVSEWIGTFDPQLAEEFWKGFVDGARADAAPAQRHREERPPRDRGVVQGRGARVARCGACRRDRRPVHEGHVVTRRTQR